MHREDQDSRTHVKQRALAATGLVATAAAGGMGVAAVTAAEAQAASGVVHACYSKSTHALKYAKGSKCPKGSKALSWNKVGSQGATGAPGAQGPAGPAEGWANERYSQDLLIHSTTSVVASFTPASAGYFAVNGVVTVEPLSGDEYISCWEQGGPGNTTNRTTEVWNRFYYSHYSGPIPTGGIVAAGPTAPVYELCKANSEFRAYSAEVTGIHLTAAHAAITGTPAARAGNRFSTKRGQKASKKH